MGYRLTEAGYKRRAAGTFFLRPFRWGENYSTTAFPILFQSAEKQWNYRQL
jgi:hypothetical protein